MIKESETDHSHSLSSLIGRREMKKIEDFCFPGSAFKSAPGLLKEMTKDFSSAISNYPPENKVIVSKMAALNNVNVYQIVFGNGTTQLINILTNLFVKKITIPVPTFGEYDFNAKNFGRDVDYYQLSKERGFRIDPQDFINHVKKAGSNSIVMVNPNNPTGVLMSRKDMEFIIKELNELDLIIIDEAYICFADESQSVISLIDKYHNLVILKSFSKKYCCPGFRLGFMVSNNKQLIVKVSKNIPEWNANSFASLFLEILPKYKKYYDNKLKKLLMERPRFIKQLSSMKGINIYDSQGNFVFCELTNGMDSIELEKKLLGRGFYIRSFPSKAGISKIFFRVSIKEKSVNNKFLKALREVLNKP